jgi:hypothetical protein
MNKLQKLNVVWEKKTHMLDLIVYSCYTCTPNIELQVTDVEMMDSCIMK